MKLTSFNVEKLLTYCLPPTDDYVGNTIDVKAVIHTFRFIKEKLEVVKDDVISMLDQLPDQFKEDQGGGWSFLQAAETKSGELWGQHFNMEQLFALGIGIGKVKEISNSVPEGWLPGQMPYYMILK